MHSAYYEPVWDPNSEFSWHQPDSQVPDYDVNVSQIDMSQFHDPWDIYRGNIPPSTEQSVPTEQTIDDYQDMRKYAWDYMPPQTKHHQNEHSHHTFEQPASSNHSHLDNQNISMYHPTQSSQHATYTHNLNEQTETMHHTSYPHSQNEQTEIMHYSPPSNYSEATQRHLHSSSYRSEPHNTQHHSEHFNDHSYQHHREFSYHNTQAQSEHKSSEQQISISNNQEPHNYHDHHYNHVDRSQDDNRFLNVPDSKSQITNHVSNTNKNLDEQDISIKHKNKRSGTYWQSLIQNMTKHVYTVMMDHVKIKYQQIAEAKVNGYDSGSDSDVYEEITPRHPYDGFYLRHRMTIDSHGRKICSHEIPMVPRSPTPDSSDEYEDALETGFEDINDDTVINEDIQVSSYFEIKIISNNRYVQKLFRAIIHN